MPNKYYLVNLLINKLYSEEELMYYFLFLEHHGLNIRKTTFDYLVLQENSKLHVLKHKNIDIVTTLKHTLLIKFFTNPIMYSFDKNHELQVILD